jgi:hypothetical protein
MNPLAAIAAGALLGYMILAIATVWAWNLCLPLPVRDGKWQCDAAFSGLAIAYFAASFVAALTAYRHKVMSALFALVALLVAHAWTPYFSLIFFGKRSYQNKYALFFVVAAALAGVLVGVLVRRRGRAHAL